MNLPRKWRKSRRHAEDPKFYLPTRGDDDSSRPIDTQEQEELIRSFEQKQTQQSLLWRSVFAGFLVCFVAFLIFSILHHASSPWELRYHAYFMEDMDSWVVISADLVAVVACLMAIKGLLHNSRPQKKWIWYSCFTGLLLAVFWLYHMLKMPRFRWDIVWLPFGPLSGAGICLYVEHLLAESSDEVRKLRGYMYSYKAS